jgi:Glycosyl hydrolase family 59
MSGIRLIAIVAASLMILVTTQTSASPVVASGVQSGSKSDLLPDSSQDTPSGASGVTTSIELGQTDTGRIFDGIGAISGGGGNSRLLIDYPAKQRNEILDYLFKPGYGASLQILKLEIGGDANSTDGSEPSVEHASGVVNCNAGYEFWLAEQAKLRNPAIKLYGLAWAAPGWIDHGNFWSPEMVKYLMTWMGCARSHGLTIDYLGGWNERGFNKTWYENLHATLEAGHYVTKVVGDDSDWRVAKAMRTDPGFAKAVDIIGVHYSCEGGDGGNADACHSTHDAVDISKPLWDSENGSQDDNSGAGPLVRAITRGYIDAKMTALLNWPLVAAITSNLPYPTTGLMVAGQPWSGNYSVGQSLWITAHVTQFAQPGWRFLDHATGYLGNERTNGSYISLRSPNGTDYSTVVETTTATVESTMIFKFGDNFVERPVAVWATNLRSMRTEDQFVHITDLHLDATGSFTFNLRPGYVYTFSTLATAGKGDAAAPPAHPLDLPYRDNFNHYKVGGEARYVSDMQGAFEIQPCSTGKSNKCLQQMAATKPIEWQDDSDAFTLLGDPTWTDYAATVDVEFAKPGVVELIGRAGNQKRPQSHQEGYYFQISDTGTWTIFKSDSDGKHSKLGSGSTNALGTGQWHRLGLSVNGQTISASLDGHHVAAIKDDSYHSGQFGMGVTSYDTDQFDNVSILPIQKTKTNSDLESIDTKTAKTSPGGILK